MSNQTVLNTRSSVFLWRFRFWAAAWRKIVHSEPSSRIAKVYSACYSIAYDHFGDFQLYLTAACLSIQVQNLIGGTEKGRFFSDRSIIELVECLKMSALTDFAGWFQMPLCCLVGVTTMPTFLVCFYPVALPFFSKLTKVLALTQVMLGVRAIGTVRLYLVLRSSSTWSRPLCQWISGGRIWAVEYGQCLTRLDVLTTVLRSHFLEFAVRIPPSLKNLGVWGCGLPRDTCTSWNQLSGHEATWTVA